ncbi:MAG: 2Fe-2S iron-sulfur cluster binding domain-containing protein [Planctomycetes bacterium]|nr:2Fe-2S iron-sulfur cluster binding domain-containing protein [Planctomycetota bacterium]
MAKITYILSESDQRTIEVDLADAPFDDHGKPASFLAIAMANDIFIEHSCGGVCACSTCHIIVEQGFSELAEASEGEEDMLDNAPALTMRSRLACQAEVPRNDGEYVVRLPSVNRNFVSEHG